MYLTAQNITFAYEASRPVLHNISLELPQRDILSIVGASGCGKSTFLRIVAGLLTDHNSFTLEGQISINGMTPEEFRNTGELAFMFQEPTLMPNLTVEENIRFPLQMLGKRDNQKVNDLIEAVGLSDFADYLPSRLSGGMKTRVSLARSFVTEPKLLLLDEPFSSLDVAWKRKLYNELAQLQKRFGSTIIIVTHDVQEAILLGNSTVVFSKSGELQEKEKICNSTSQLDRLRNFSNFIGSNQFQKLYVKIQKIIIDDEAREVVTETEIDNLLRKLESVAGVEKEEASIKEWDVIEFRKFSNKDYVHEAFVSAFRKAKTAHFKAFLIYDILNYNQINKKLLKDLADFAVNNMDLISKNSKNYFKREGNELFTHILNNRIHSKQIPKHKKWVYMCCFAALKNKKTIKFLESVTQNEIDELNYPLAKKVAKKILDDMKMVNEDRGLKKKNED